jgi:hypothetical protein
MSIDELLARLARLDARDRAWLLGELPPTMRRDIATMLADDAENSEAVATSLAGSGWETMDVQRLAAVLECEPAWLVSAATRGTEPRWRERLLQAMGSRRRHDIELADRSGGAFGARAMSLVLEGGREKLDSDVDAGRESPGRQGFAALLDRMRGRFS